MKWDENEDRGGGGVNALLLTMCVGQRRLPSQRALF